MRHASHRASAGDNANLVHRGGVKTIGSDVAICSQGSGEISNDSQKDHLIILIILIRDAMPKINAMLDDEAHRILTDYKRIHKSRNLDEALISLIKEHAIKGSLYSD